MFTKFIVSETTYEVASTGYLYRVIEKSEGTMLKRTKIEGGSWTNGLLLEIFDTDSYSFVPAVKDTPGTFTQMSRVDALLTIEIFTEQRK